MAITITKRIQVTVDTLRMTLGERAWDDPDEDWSKLPFLNGSTWTVDVELATGKIKGWPGPAFDLFVKVCDEGLYVLLDGDKEVARRDGYVPHGIVPGDSGDYVSLKIAADGTITNWPKRPDLSAFDERSNE